MARRMKRMKAKPKRGTARREEIMEDSGICWYEKGDKITIDELRLDERAQSATGANAMRFCLRYEARHKESLARSSSIYAQHKSKDKSPTVNPNTTEDTKKPWKDRNWRYCTVGNSCQIPAKLQEPKGEMRGHSRSKVPRAKERGAGRNEGRS